MVKIQKTILSRVEGEIELKLIWEKGIIKDAFIIAPNFRGFEFILEGKPILDSLIITPRVCGICGHAHLMATVNALENLYKNAGYNIEISKKANLIRLITLSAEIVQNHLRWFYLFVFPDLLKLETYTEDLSEYIPIKGKQWQKAIDFSSKIVKVIAIFGGQWPHTSYSIPGGVVCDPTTFDITESISIVDSMIKYYEENIIGMKYENYLSIEDYKEFIEKSDKDLSKFLKLCFKHNLHKIGKAYNRFLTVSNIYPIFSQGATKRKKYNFNIKKLEEIDTYSFLTKKGIDFNGKKYSWAKAVRYEGFPYETGPLARRINNKDKLFLNLLADLKDTYIPRIWARIDEIIKLLLAMKKWLQEIDIKEPSYIKPKKNIKELEGIAYGLCEAARGSLIHKLEVKEGKIKKYDIITPSTWNLGPRCEKYLSPAEKAIIGLDNSLIAEMVLRSFDVCSVCTTH
ncbi:nickel-dependent hydrogenase large subunit [Hydrogenothermus marinus]|uniref:Ni,Fe-hydrogenase I large subunit n=1 Tax=Hydrogenothermus marinus TaxID=133270 RepID=A0A3M0BNJ4_9AQUI|nr:nickel-dependent hydrogenase large subunit [Hydrogenothermus marinus]RMA97859.1 Ni,Fe-hydrogenase I large subunit [Hydrogenothermus marinus]